MSNFNFNQGNSNQGKELDVSVNGVKGKINKISLSTRDGISYIHKCYTDKHVNELKEQMVNDSLRYVRSSLMASYFTPCPSYEMENSTIRNKAIMEYNGDMLIDLINQALSEDVPYITHNMLELRVHIKQTKEIVHINVDRSDKHTLILVSNFNLKDNVCTVFNFIIEPDNTIHSGDLVAGPYAISKKERDAENTLKMFLKTVRNFNGARQITEINVATVHTYLSIVQWALERFIDTHPIHLQDLPLPDYSSAEMAVFKTIMKKHDNRLYRFNTYNSMLNDQLPDTFDKNQYFPYSISDQDFIDKLLDKQLYPIVDFSEKEWKFINRYCAGNKLEYDYDEDVDIDMSDILVNQRYGNSLVIKSNAGDSNNELREYRVTYDYDRENDSLTVFVIDESNVEFTVGMQYLLFNMKHYNLDKCLYIMRSKFYCHNIDKLPSSASDLKKRGVINDVFNSSESMANILIDFFKILMVIHDRPKRSIMIREEKKSDIKPVTSNKSGNKRNQPVQQESNFVTSRILIPAREVTDYIKRMYNTDPTKERQYTVESWTRDGHERHYANGKVKWIEPTTCHRQKPLTDKEIHIKL